MFGFLSVIAATAPTEIKIEGWTVKLEQGVMEDPAWWPARRELTRQLQDIKRVVGDEPLSKLQKVTIWVNSNSPVTPCMAYHPGREWLADHDVNPDMAKGIELANCKNFVSWTYEQPWMVLHELAHAYHDQFLDKGFENPIVLTAFRKGMETKKYDLVLHWNGKQEKHYATTNQMEYFAETTESYFGTNDFYPFVKAELMNYDPDAYQLMRQIWGERVKRANY